MVSKIIYVILLLVTWYLSIMFSPEAIRFILGFELLLPVIMLISLQFMTHKVTVSPEEEKDQIQKGEFWNVILKVNNPGWMPIPFIRVELEYEEILTQKKQNCRFWGKAGGRKETEIVCRMKEKYCGKIRVTLKTVRIYDYLRLFSKKIAAEGQAEIAVLPEIYITEVFQNPISAHMIMDSEEHDESRPGSDVSEVFQIREYQKGDTLQRIHWKLSAREDELMVKDYSLPLGYRVMLYLDYHLPQNMKRPEVGLDGMIEIAMALSFSMLMARCPHYLFWCTKEGLLERRGIREEEDLYEALEAVLGTGIYQEDLDGMDMYRQLYPDDIPNIQLMINMQLELWKKGRLLKKFGSKHLKDELESFGLEV